MAFSVPDAFIGALSEVQALCRIQALLSAEALDEPGLAPFREALATSADCSSGRSDAAETAIRDLGANPARLSEAAWLQRERFHLDLGLTPPPGLRASAILERIWLCLERESLSWKRLMRLAPLLDDPHARDLAGELLRGWLALQSSQLALLEAAYLAERARAEGQWPKSARRRA